MPLHRPQLLPVLTAALFPATFLTTYGIAVRTSQQPDYLTDQITTAVQVSQGHVDSLWPYISDTGTTPPESCIFGQLLNLGAALLTLTFYIRYKQATSVCSLLFKYRLIETSTGLYRSCAGVRHREEEK